MRDLAALAAGAAVVAWLLIRSFYGDIPPLPYSAALTTFLIAVSELVLAPSIRARLAGRPRTKPIMPIAVARVAALAKASSALGGLSVGCWAGALAFLLSRQDLRHARTDAVVAGASLAAGALLVVAALRLERACRVPRVPPGEGTARPAT